ncbi:hypothetical protein TGRUB_245746C [Toxoplasma gondii RUB]|uniref:Uncharacterized protein n=1 Tax=Toxoplasma gondii RUB TaxID=935652 RepID=A0A086M6X4_TOXGO|nr:hypothetical protein TGRUB_245746C [Toxoplasma gondii RUB]
MDRRGCAGTVLLGQATDEVIKQQLADLLGPKNSFTPQLLQLFNRKVKKARRPVAASVEEDEEEDEDFRQLGEESMRRAAYY